MMCAKRKPERIKNGAELIIMANPSEGAAASKLYSEFHGSDAKHIDEYEVPTPRPRDLTELGALVELRVKRCTGWKHGLLDLSGLGIKVASNAAGTQIYFVGGNQKISRGQLTHLGADNSKELIDLGACNYIAYRTKKTFVNDANATYEHHLGEVTGVHPRLMYDKRGPVPQIYFVGGEYTVEGRGIVN